MRERAQRFDPRQTMRGLGFEIFHYREPKPETVEMHHHDFYEIYCFLGGDVEYWVEGRICRLRPGDLLLISPMELHRPLVNPHQTVYERIVLWINKDYLNGLSADGVPLSHCFDSAQPTHTNLLHLSSAQRPVMIARLGELVREYYSAEFGHAFCAEGIFRQFMVELNRLFRQKDAHRAVREESSPLVSRVLEYIGEHYSEELSLEMLAQQFYVSKYHLSHEFSRTVGVGVYRYIMLKRLLIAKQMLTDGTPPGEVCGLCGFRDYTNFYRAFKAEYGISPRAVERGAIPTKEEL